MDKFTLLKLDRAIWTAFIENQNIPEAVKYYQIYIDCLENFDADEYLITQEIEFSKRLFQKKIITCANNFFNEHDIPNAAIAYSIAFKNDVKDVKTLKNYITCLDELKQYDLKLEIIKHLEEIAGSNVEINNLLSQTYEQQNDIPQAISYTQKCIESEQEEEKRAEYYNNLGFLYDKYANEVPNKNKREELQKSLIAFETASDLLPSSRLYAKNAAILANKINNHISGKKYWTRLINNACLTNDDKFDYGAYSLKVENFSDWYKYFDARFEKESGPTSFPKIDKPKWDGTQDLSNSTLLIHYEQGFGDTFMMWGYIPRLLKLAKHIIFVTQYETYNLLKNNEYGVEVYSKDYVDLKKLNFDYYIPSMSVPLVLKPDRTNLSVGEGYIKVSNDLVSDFKQKYFNNDKFKIGFSFSGNKTGTRSRDIEVEEFLTFDELENVQFYNLTKNLPDSKFEIFKKNKVINIVKHAYDFADTAAIIMNCDVIVTADNCILNLAGALGKKTFALFNWNNNFRWFDLSGDNVIWYTSVKPYVCDDINNWQSAIIPAMNDIKKLKAE